MGQKERQQPDDPAADGTPKAAPESTGDEATPAAPAQHVERCDAKLPDCRQRKLHSTDWLGDIPGGYAHSEYVEVQFKNTRKGYFRNCTNLALGIGDLVAVESSPGHDIGTVSLTGALAELRMRRSLGKNGSISDIRRIFRKAKPADIEKYEEAKAKEDDTMIRARQIADSLKLNMKIGDVEYQGDGNKAIFYYIADERVDFRQLIKVLAETFKVRIEMKQIGARQEAGRIGGIGPCGRPLCCSQWMTNFVSVATSAARYQDISLNPQKLAGQCAKLKCCLNFEVDAYVEASKRMPPKDAVLETADGNFYQFKADIFARTICYSTDKSLAANLVTISAERAFEIIAMNKAGEKPLSLIPDAEQKPKQRSEFGDILGEDDDLARFDKKKKKKKKKPQGQKPQAEQAGNDERQQPRQQPGRQPRQQERKPQGGQKPQGQKPQENRPGQQRPQGQNPGKKKKRRDDVPQDSPAQKKNDNNTPPAE